MLPIAEAAGFVGFGIAGGSACVDPSVCSERDNAAVLSTGAFPFAFEGACAGLTVAAAPGVTAAATAGVTAAAAAGVTAAAKALATGADEAGVDALTRTLCTLLFARLELMPTTGLPPASASCIACV